MRIARGFGGMLPREFFLERCNMVRFRVYFVFIFFTKITIFYIKINILDTHLFMGTYFS